MNKAELQAELIPVIKDVTNSERVEKLISDIIDFIPVITEPPYKNIVGFITQTGTNPPEVIELENSFGNHIVWVYDGIGRYTGTFIGMPENEGWILPTNLTHFREQLIADDETYYIEIQQTAVDTITMITYKAVASLMAFEDDVLSIFFVNGQLPFEMRVYN